MPYIQVSLYPGRSDQQKQDFAKEITKSAVEILKTKEEHVIVVFDENPKENWFLAGNQLKTIFLFSFYLQILCQKLHLYNSKHQLKRKKTFQKF